MEALYPVGALAGLRAMIAASFWVKVAVAYNSSTEKDGDRSGKLANVATATAICLGLASFLTLAPVLADLLL